MIMAVILSSVGALSAAGNGNGVIIYGDVTSSSGKSVKEVKIKITNVCQNQTTEVKAAQNSGAFEFSGEYCNTYVVEASADGYATSSQIVEVNAENVISVKLKLTEKKAETPEKKAVDAGIDKKSYGATGFETPFTS